ncbi:hypothetical protein [Anaplasma bovis]|uniref:hypothetical protein n=1 Tax=Anaplasma bovis TaxID=186733 RepID=UPI002FF2B9C2
MAEYTIEGDEKEARSPSKDLFVIWPVQVSYCTMPLLHNSSVPTLAHHRLECGVFACVSYNKHSKGIGPTMFLQWQSTLFVVMCTVCLLSTEWRKKGYQINDSPIRKEHTHNHR